MENKEKNIPVYEFIINDDGKEHGLTAISIVDEPAILVDFLKFDKQEDLKTFQISSKEKMELTGPAMIAGMRIFRHDDSGEYYGYFSKETIEKMFERFMEQGKLKEFSIMHNGEIVQGAFIKEAWLTGKPDKSEALGFNLPEGSLMITVKCSPELWEKVNTMDLKGFSIECFADIKRAFKKEVNSKLEFILDLINQEEELIQLRELISKMENQK